MFFTSLALSFLLSIIFLFAIDKKLNTVLGNYIDSEVDKIASNIIHYALKNVNSSSNNYLIVEKKDNIIENISYNTVEINRLRDELVDSVQKEFSAIESGDFSHYSFAHQEKYRMKYPNMKSGYMCEVSIHSLQNSTLFGNLGPTIPVKLSFMGFVTSDVDVKMKEYGINNVILEVDIVVKVSNMITMPISSRIHDVEVRDVLSVEVIRGEIPRYYSGVFQ